jgi:hypothetical protein
VNQKAPNIIRGERVVAVFDILGYRQLIKETRPQDLFHIASLAQFLGGDCAVDPSIIGSFVFSDTIVLYGQKGHHQLEAAMLAVSCSNLLGVSARRGWSLRGALTFGHLYIDHKANAIVGPAIVKAMELESAQEWMGAIVDPDFNDLYQDAMKTAPEPLHNNLVRYPAPLKTGKRVPYLCVGWMQRASVTEENLKFHFFKGRPDETHEVYRKYANTADYFRFCEKNGLLKL